MSPVNQQTSLFSILYYMIAKTSTIRILGVHSKNHLNEKKFL